MIAKPEKVLESVFGYSKFRDTQKEIIDTVLSGKDALVLMPTGGGKSLCYQIPALCKPGTAIVVSPLIALMKDQVDALKLHGVKAEFLNSTLDPMEQKRIVSDLRRGNVDLLYISPERINESFWNFLESLELNLFAVDEAHCISHWGHDFRPDYRKLQVLKQRFPDVPLIALTATADQLTRDDILGNLRMRFPEVFVSSFNRPNIKYLVEPKRRSFDKLVDFLREQNGESGIIYCLSRASTEELAEDLRSLGFNAIHYHAQLDRAERAKNQELFSRDEVQIVVATIAFGMGIDKSNVRFVVHMDLPKNIESYYQETGRAGRDGLDSTALLFYSYADMIKLKSFVELDDNPEQSEVMLDKLEKISAFASSKICRRKFLLNYFGEKAPSYCGNCDVCLANFERVEATKEAQIAISAVVRLNQKFGANYLIDFVKGSQSEKIRAAHKSLPTYGVGSDLTKPEWKGVLGSILEQGYLKRSAGEYPVLQLTDKSWDILKGRSKFFYNRRKEKLQSFSGRPVVAENCETELLERLKKWRTGMARAEGVAPYMVFHDNVLKELATYLPQADDDLWCISGIGEVKKNTYGAEILKLVNNHCRMKNLTFRPPAGASSKRVKKSARRKANTKNSTYQKTRKFLEKGLSIAEVANERGYSESTIFGHLAQLIEAGEIEVDRFVDKKARKEIEGAIAKHGCERLSPIRTALNNAYTFNLIKLVVAGWKAQQNREKVG
ncbi:MAG: DNA helicase RecQ [Saprospirales bacterium]|nr:MAG: DNA helicase RecQ [Saprospirales bacterium]